MIDTAGEELMDPQTTHDGLELEPILPMVDAPVCDLTSINGSLMEFVDVLVDMTQSREIRWERIESARYSFNDVAAGKVTVWLTDPGNGVMVTMTIQDPSDCPVLGIGADHLPQLKVLFEAVRRSIFNVDEIIGLMIGELKNGKESDAKVQDHV